MTVIRQALDLTKYAWRQQHGDITVYGTWWLGDKEGPFPVMALVPTHRQMGLSYVPCVVTLDLAWIWSEETGDELYAADTAMSFAQSLGIGATRKNMMRVLSIIREHIEDMLKRIPPRPSDDRKIVGDFIARDQETGRERHMEIKE